MAVEKVTCPRCEGAGEWEFKPYGSSSPEDELYECSVCLGEGTCTPGEAAWWETHKRWYPTDRDRRAAS